MGEPNPPTAWVRLYPWSLSEAKQGHFSSVQHQSVYTCVCVEVAVNLGENHQKRVGE